MHGIKGKYLLFSLAFLASICFAQEKSQDLTLVDSSQFASPQKVLLSSVILPGLGQIKQERLWKATLFYGTAATFYYRTAYHYDRYKKTNNEKYLDKAKVDLTVAGIVHLVNIVDAYYFGYHKKPMGWNGALFSDKPVKSPWGATLRSAIFPGWGQWYNESYFKSAVYLGIASYVGYKIHWNKKKYRETGEAKFEDDRSRFSWYLGLTYLLMLTDAHVDAHLFDFDNAVELAVSPSPIDKAIKLSLSISF
jgi:hypothetical protein